MGGGEEESQTDGLRETKRPRNLAVLGGGARGAPECAPRVCEGQGGSGCEPPPLQGAGGRVAAGARVRTGVPTEECRSPDPREEAEEGGGV